MAVETDFTSRLPARGHYIFRNAHLLTFDRELGDIRRGDVQVDAGVIVAVGEAGLHAADATVIEAADMILMPGLIDAHSHLWTTQMRGRFGVTSRDTYFSVRNRLAEGYLPQDMYHGTLLGAAEAICAGITTVVDFCHNNRGPPFVDACLRALRDSGLRCRYLFGAATNTLPTQSVNLKDLEALARSWPELSPDAPVTLGLGWRGPLGITTADLHHTVGRDSGIAREEFDAARGLKLPIALHVSGTAAKAQFDALVHGGYLGPDLQLIHFTNASDADIRTAAQAGAAVCLTPLTELRVGYGITRLREYVTGGLRVGLGIDGSALAGTSSLFAVMKLLQLIEAGRLQDETAVTARELLKLATLQGAQSLGIDDEVGSIRVGKRADLILIRTQDLSSSACADVADPFLVEAVQPANVDTVMIDGRILKRHGQMVALEASRAVSQARESMAAIERRVSC